MKELFPEMFEGIEDANSAIMPFSRQDLGPYRR